MFQKKALVFCGVLFLVSASVFSWVVTERFRLGAVIEGTAFISTGPLAGKAAFIDGWNVYVNDLAGGAYEKLFSVDATLFGPAPRGIVYLGQGDFTGNFILTDIGNSNTLFLVSTSDSLISRIVAQDLSWPRCEGATQITNGPFQGDIAILHQESANPPDYHVAIFRMVASDGEIHAYHRRDIPLGYRSADNYLTGITFLPDDSPYPNHFAVVDVSGLIIIIDDMGVQKATIGSAWGIEGLTYIPSGPYQGSLLIADYAAWETAIINLDGSVRTQISIPVGMRLYSATSVTWLKDRQQLAVFSRALSSWNNPMYLISQSYPGHWVKNAEFKRTELKSGLSMTDMTRNGTYYLKGSVDSSPGYLPYEIHELDANFQLVNKIRLPNLPPKSFGRLIYVSGSTAADDRFLVQNLNNVYSFDVIFTYPPGFMDLSGKVNSLGPFCYDPEVRRYYVHDRSSSGLLLRVFDQNWNPLAEYNISSLSLPGVSDITKFTSGGLKGNVAFLNAGDNELVIVNFEYQIATDLLGKLSQDVLASGIKSGLAKELSKELQVAFKSVENKNIGAAVNQIREFQASVRAQRGKGIPVNMADEWLARSEEIIRGLESL